MSFESSLLLTVVIHSMQDRLFFKPTSLMPSVLRICSEVYDFSHVYTDHVHDRCLYQDSIPTGVARLEK